MALILPVNDISPKIGKKCFLAPTSTITGEVVMGDECSVWFNAVVRGDVNSITIGN
ncbi:MAG TPA: gamma carbonic anhydrase family protein, partial [Bacteroidia bacterium]|nr:gamma carbonic anhydrase family protein [Bacteroidia bacterium]